MDPANAQTVTELISSVGFPIFVACWLLFRSDKILTNLTEAINELAKCMAEIKNLRGNGG